MATTAFPVKQSSDGVGCTDATLRMIVGSVYQSVGVISGLSVSGTDSLYYSVSPGVAVCSKGDSDGKTVAYSEAANTPAVSSNTTSYPRIDSVWITSHDITQGDSDNLVTVGVTEGTAAATPKAPTIPTYATLLMNKLLPAGATTTKNATNASSIQSAIPYGASLGVLHSYQNTWDGLADGSSVWVTEDSATITLSSDRLIEFRYARCMSCDDSTGSIVIEFFLDGSPFVQSEMSANGRWETHQFNFIKEVQAGTHVFAVKNRHQSGSRVYYHYAAGSERGDSPLNGMTFDIVDRGIVR